MALITHFFDHEADVTDQYFNGRQELSNQDYLAFVTDYDKESHICTMSQRNYFIVGDTVEFITPNMEIIKFKIDNLYDEDMNSIDTANHAEETIKMKLDFDIIPNSMLRKAYL